ncbi:sensor histidine kinase [Paenibacillus antarcticus]|uniref:histidine kinase n=1 Tax=Paenibacillus antarcticus TaxID=253703 RepID=A0A168MPG8_9BACL|nr:sensor histidine kinase [Paenibacillus antarcticus]OAB44910.1 two-component sensor histidine kinase [Paenibacillus antarcticus]
MARRFRSIHSRLFFLFLTCMTTILIIVSFLYYSRSLDIIHSKISDIAQKNISQTAGLFDLMLEGYNSVTKSLNGNYELTRLLQETTNNPAVSVINERTITNIIGATFFSRKEIVGIHIITNAGKVYSYERQFGGVIDINYEQKEWYLKLKASSGNMVWLGFYPSSPVNRMQQDTVFVFGRQLYDLTAYKSIGMMIIETNPAPITEALSNVSISPNTRAFITGKDDHIIAKGEQEGEFPVLNNLPKPSNGHKIIVDDESDQLIVAAKTSLADWTIYGITPKSDLNAEINQTRLYLAIVIIALIIVSTVLASLVSRTIASPLKLLIREMKKVELGNFSGSVNVNSFDEINSLVSSFNRMVHRMDELIERITLSSVSEKNAQLQALQSQVNPHFLYNTLDMIYWMLDEKENERLSRVILSLSQMFRYSSNWGEASQTTLGQELEQIRHYLTIIEIRLDGRLETEINVSEEWLDVILPKVTIQPIIENAVKYGLEPLGTPCKLQVFAEQHGHELHISITDHGLGMDEETLRQVRESLGMNANVAIESIDQPRRGIGLHNVHARINMMFGEAYGIRVESHRGQGTTVTVVIPIPLQRRHADEYSHRR